MWPIGELLAAAEDGGASDSLIVMGGGVIVAAIGALGLVLVEIVKGRNSRTTMSPPAARPEVIPITRDVELYERTAVNSRRLDDADERHHTLELYVRGEFEDQDGRIERIERRLGIHDDDTGNPDA